MKNFFKKITAKLTGTPASSSSEKASDTSASTTKSETKEAGDPDVWKPGDGSPKPAGEGQKRKRNRSRNRGGQGQNRKSDGEKREGQQGGGNRKPRKDGERSQSGQRNNQNRRRNDRRDGDRRDGKRQDRPRSGDKPFDQGKAKQQREREAAAFAKLMEEHEAWDPGTFQVPEVEGKKRFHDFALSKELMHAVADLGFEYCTPVQAESIGFGLEGRDVAGQAQTGTGKTAAFLIAILMRLRENIPEKPANGTPRALIIAPTRELVLQIEKDAIALSKYCPNRVMAVFGGTDFKKQMDNLKESVVDIVCATPGRLLQFRREGTVDLRKVEIMVVDEADRMLDMGFMPDVRAIFNSLPAKEKRQTLLYSATLDKTVMNLAAMWMTDPAMVDIEPEMVTVDTVNQVVYLVQSKDKDGLVYNLIKSQNMDRVIIFVNRRVHCEKLHRILVSRGINCEILSGAVPQNKRTRILQEFRNETLPVLIATDVAGRGLHIEGLNYVINYDIPYAAEEYVHRIGRTGRAGRKGTSITLACEEESFTLMDIEEYIGRALECSHPEEDLLTLPEATHPMPKRREPQGGGGQGRGGRSGGGNRSRNGGRSNGGRSGGGRQGGQRRSSNNS